MWFYQSGNIWKTKLDFDVWQLFVDWEEMVMARWPNAKFSDGSVWDKKTIGHMEPSMVIHLPMEMVT